MVFSPSYPFNPPRPHVLVQTKLQPISVFGFQRALKRQGALLRLLGVLLEAPHREGQSRGQDAAAGGLEQRDSHNQNPDPILPCKELRRHGGWGEAGEGEGAQISPK